MRCYLALSLFAFAAISLVLAAPVPQVNADVSKRAPEADPRFPKFKRDDDTVDAVVEREATPNPFSHRLPSFKKRDEGVVKREPIFMGNRFGNLILFFKDPETTKGKKTGQTNSKKKGSPHPAKKNVAHIKRDDGTVDAIVEREATPNPFSHRLPSFKKRDEAAVKREPFFTGGRLGRFVMFAEKPPKTKGTQQSTEKNVSHVKREAFTRLPSFKKRDEPSEELNNREAFTFYKYFNNLTANLNGNPEKRDAVTVAGRTKGEEA